MLGQLAARGGRPKTLMLEKGFGDSDNCSLIVAGRGVCRLIVFRHELDHQVDVRRKKTRRCYSMCCRHLNLNTLMICAGAVQIWVEACFSLYHSISSFESRTLGQCQVFLGIYDRDPFPVQSSICASMTPYPQAAPVLHQIFLWSGPPGEQRGHRTHYQQFTLNNQQYKLGDCVYLYPEDEALPHYIGKIKSAFVDSNYAQQDPHCIEVRSA